ncbi:MAG TPA: Asp-tRNA(Asn)/Glu-tRNA(Gln) amidotransferase subunit GatB [Saprospiraceae bacterium]|nr:Asp-tRNA(Asn)/Glu-tRNA(Gln) amidotransferase subunit GatB [Saprospiraceae bacterium]HNT21231.1 Asp-tRNA(Asn)/Glu-tRNA(Gln) amidotransferase subunit GatB [Saprospiraceae bacterium]
MTNSTSSWETIIGLEIHIQLNTLTKAFCDDPARFSTEANTQTGYVSLAHPGTLPLPNGKQVESAVRLGLALDCTINTHSWFERKQYFYPDLPKGYQISQQASPVCLGGRMDLETSQGSKTIRIHHIHMEEDAGKSVHDTDPVWSRIDLNRAGVPLLEMVTEPDFRTAEEVTVFLTDLQRLVRYLDISDANMEEGSMRCDVNVSVRPSGSEEYRERCEVKNINSRRFARKAIEFESARQIALWEAGQAVVRQTMQFVPEEGVTVPIRQKESAHDYRYFPDPDLPPIKISQAQLDTWRNSIPTLPSEYLRLFTREKNLSLADAQVLAEDPEVARYYVELVQEEPALNKSAANWLIQTMLPWLREQNKKIGELPFGVKSLGFLLSQVRLGVLNLQQAQEVWIQITTSSQASLEDLVKEKLDAARQFDIPGVVEDLFSSFPVEADEFKKGKKKLLGFFLGEIKKKFPGIPVKEVQEALNRYLAG